MSNLLLAHQLAHSRSSAVTKTLPDTLTDLGRWVAIHAAVDPAVLAIHPRPPIAPMLPGADVIAVSTPAGPVLCDIYSDWRGVVIEEGVIQPRLKIIRDAGYITQLIDRRSGGTDPGIGERANSLLAAAELPVPTAAAARVRDAVHEGRGPKSVGQIGEETALENKILWPALARLVVAGEAAVALGWRLWRETAVMSLADPTDRAIAALATSPFAPYALPKIGSLTDSPNERSWH